MLSSFLFRVSCSWSDKKKHQELLEAKPQMVQTSKRTSELKKTNKQTHNLQNKDYLHL